jgi:chromosome segregation ATPase
MNQKKANAEKVRKNSLARCNTGTCSSANQYLADLTNTNILKMTRKQLNNAIASRNNVQKKYNQELANHQANRNLAAIQWAEYNANLQRTKNSLQSVEESYRIAKEKANKANLSNAERIAAERSRNNLQKKLNEERRNMNNAYARGAKLQEDHNKAVSDLEESSKMLEDGYNEHLRIVGEKDDELKRKQEELDAALEKAGRANASNAQRNNALASVAALQTSVDNITAQLGDVEKEKAEKEEELRKQKEFMESEYKRGELLWKQKEDEIKELNDKLSNLICS